MICQFSFFSLSSYLTTFLSLLFSLSLSLSLLLYSSLYIYIYIFISLSLSLPLSLRLSLWTEAIITSWLLKLTILKSEFRCAHKISCYISRQHIFSLFSHTIIALLLPLFFLVVVYFYFVYYGYTVCSRLLGHTVISWNCKHLNIISRNWYPKPFLYRKKYQGTRMLFSSPNSKISNMLSIDLDKMLALIILSG